MLQKKGIEKIIQTGPYVINFSDIESIEKIREPTRRPEYQINIYDIILLFFRKYYYHSDMVFIQIIKRMLYLLGQIRTRKKCMQNFKL